MWRGNNNVEYEGKKKVDNNKKRRSRERKINKIKKGSLPILEQAAAILGRPGTAMVAAAVVAPAAAETVNFLLFYK